MLLPASIVRSSTSESTSPGQQRCSVTLRAKLPSGYGTWPAIWLLHSDPTVYGPWPVSGEIDIMEAFNLGVQGNTAIKSSTHYGLPTQPPEGTNSDYDTGVSPDMAFHEYTLEWERDKLRFYVDGVHFQTQNAQEWYAYYPADEDGFYNEFGAYEIGRRDSPFDQLFHLIINFAIGGDPARQDKQVGGAHGGDMRRGRPAAAADQVSAGLAEGQGVLAEIVRVGRVHDAPADLLRPTGVGHHG